MKLKKRKNILFYSETQWAFASIYRDLIQYLWSEGYNCVLMDFNRTYTITDIIVFLEDVDLVVIPFSKSAVDALKSYCVPMEKCIFTIHAYVEFTDFIKTSGLDDINQVIDSAAGYSCITEFLCEQSEKIGIRRKAKLTYIGVNSSRFQINRQNQALNNIAYAGALPDNYRDPNHPSRISDFSNEINDDFSQIPKFYKRYFLIEEVAKRVGLPLHLADNMRIPYFAMPGFYRRSSCVMVASSLEGCCMPVMEGGMAGCLVMAAESWQGGHVLNPRVGGKGVDILPNAANEYIEAAVEKINYYRDNPDKYRQRCQEIAAHAESYDWSYCLHQWIEMLEGK